MARGLLIALAIAWIPYGLYLALVPSALSSIAGVVSISATGETELRAMYGGLQIAIGMLCVLALARTAYTQPVLAVMAILLAGLFSARLFGALMAGASPTTYTMAAMVFELGGSLACLAAQNRAAPANL